VSVGIDSSTLLGWYQSFYGGSGTGTGYGNTGTSTTSILASGDSAAAATPSVLYAPTPPWSQAAVPTSTLVQTALSGQSIINPSAAKLDLAGASSDYKNLFALYQGLDTLYDVASQANGANVSSYQLSQLSAAFTSGLAQVQQFVSDTNFSKLRLTTGTTAATETSTESTPAQPTQYDTTALNTTGNSSAVVPAFEGDVQFNVNVQAGATSTTIAMNLNDMGSTPRTMANVLAYLNGQMQAGGAIASFSSNPMPAQPQTINVGGKSVTVSAGEESWGLQLNTDPYETVTLSAPTTAPAVYVGQVVGNTTSSIAPNGTTTAPDAQSQLLKLQVGGTAITPPDPGALAAPDQTWLDNLGGAVNSIQATATASDGSVYVLANVNTALTGASGSVTSGGQDVALMHYDSAGNLIFQTDLGAASNASGLSLAVSADGTQVAVAGAVNGPLATGQALQNPTGTNSFVAVYDAQGDQVWSQENNGISGNQANGVAFGDDGSVYVTGQSATTVGGTLQSGAASSSYLTTYSSSGVKLSSTQIATGGVNTGASVAVDGTNVYVAGVQNGDAVVSEYDMSTPATPTLVATRDLGSLSGGGIAGVSVQNGTVYVAGSTGNGALNAGTVTSAYSGNFDAFAATLSTGLAPASSDAVAYYGGAGGNTTATGMTVSNGQVFLTGTATGALPGQPAIGAQDGYAAELNVGTGQVGWSQRFTGEDGQVAPTSISVAASGSSILDQLGLPTGVVDAPVSNLITATTSVQAGDSFGISGIGNLPTTITITNTDTMATLAEKISRATGSTVNVSAVSRGGGTVLEIQPLDPYATVTLTNGPAGANALPALGLQAGILYTSTTGKGASKPADGKAPVYGLSLSPTLSLASSSDISTAMSELTGAMATIKGAYQALKTAATPANVLALQAAQAQGGGVPAYLSAQIASYQSALSRLTAGSGTGTTSGASAASTLLG
jgi:hypothetical protein